MGSRSAKIKPDHLFKILFQQEIHHNSEVKSVTTSCCLSLVGDSGPKKQKVQLEFRKFWDVFKFELNKNKIKCKSLEPIFYSQ